MRHGKVDLAFHRQETQVAGEDWARVSSGVAHVGIFSKTVSFRHAWQIQGVRWGVSVGPLPFSSQNKWRGVLVASAWRLL